MAQGHERSKRAQVRNPVLGLPAAKRLLMLPLAARKVLAKVLADLHAEASEQAESAWQRRKGPMAAYWRAVATYAGHIARVVRPRPPLVALTAQERRERDQMVERLARYYEGMIVSRYLAEGAGNPLEQADLAHLVADALEIVRQRFAVVADRGHTPCGASVDEETYAPDP